MNRKGFHDVTFKLHLPFCLALLAFQIYSVSVRIKPYTPGQDAFAAFREYSLQLHQGLITARVAYWPFEGQQGEMQEICNLSRKDIQQIRHNQTSDQT